MIQKFYASHIKDMLDTAAINVWQPRKRANAEIEGTDYGSSDPSDPAKTTRVC
jgi:hypothetical protein